MSNKKRNLYLFWGYLVILIFCLMRFLWMEEINSSLFGAILFHIPMIYNISYELVNNLLWRFLIYILICLSLLLIISIYSFPQFTSTIAVLLDIFTFLQFTTKIKKSELQ